MKLLVMLAVCVAVGCGNEASSSDRKAAGELCIAENAREDLAPSKEAFELRVRGVGVRVPNRQVLVSEATGELIEVRDHQGALLESFKVDPGKLKSEKLCLYHRARVDATRTEGWVVDAAANAPRCTCW